MRNVYFDEKMNGTIHLALGYGFDDIGGFDCNPSGPFGTYQWTVSGLELTLRPMTEPCRDRRGILTGKWTRMK